MLPTADSDRLAIRELVENWALWRDAGDWERFATVWHPTEGWMTATWFQGPARDFIAASRQGFDAGVSILHFLGGHTADVAGDRAVAQTKMTINQRAEIDGVTVDVVCTDASTTPAPGTRDGGRSFAASPSMRRTASTSWIPRAPSAWTLRCSPGSRSATGTWATSRPGSGSR